MFFSNSVHSSKNAKFTQSKKFKKIVFSSSSNLSSGLPASPQNCLPHFIFAKYIPIFISLFHSLNYFRRLDFVNLMAYDLHGSWESTVGCHSALHPRSGDPSPTLNVVSLLYSPCRSWEPSPTLNVVSFKHGNNKSDIFVLQTAIFTDDVDIKHVAMVHARIQGGGGGQSPKLAKFDQKNPGRPWILDPPLGCTFYGYDGYMVSVLISHQKV